MKYNLITHEVRIFNLTKVVFFFLLFLPISTGKSTCIRSSGLNNETRYSSSLLANSSCLGDEIHLSAQFITIGLSPKGSIGTSALYSTRTGTSWHKLPLGIMIDHDMDGMQSNFKGDFISRDEDTQHFEGKFKHSLDFLTHYNHTTHNLTYQKPSISNIHTLIRAGIRDTALFETRSFITKGSMLTSTQGKTIP